MKKKKTIRNIMEKTIHNYISMLFTIKNKK